jgi:uncharacterized protein with ParB-like and HNH nuclease domain/predicted transport protein
MKASEASLLTFLKKAEQFVIPIYQRTYSWTEKQCRQLWDDIIRAGTHDDISVHFIGSIVYVAQDLALVTQQTPMLVIDGQQRLTTITLILEALARAVGEEEPVDGFSDIKIRHHYLCNALERGDRYHKLLLSQTDNESLKALIKNTEEPKEPSQRISENFAFFTQMLAERANDLAPVCRGLAKLYVVDIALTRGQDNPQLIFESMNSTGKALSQADLIRNYVLMGLEPELQTRLYEQYWRPMEVDFGAEANGWMFDSFVRHNLTLKTRTIPREQDVYEAFKDYTNTKPIVEAGIEALVKDLRQYAHHYCAMALDQEKNAALRQAFQDLRELRVDVAYPLLLELYHDHATGLLEAAELLAAVRLIEGYVFRRSVCGIATNSLNKTFANAGKELKKDRYLESLRAHFLLLPSYRRMPNDEEFRREIQTRDLYSFRTRSYWLRKLENHGRKEPVAVDEYTIEHIMPQNENLCAEWQQALGADWKRVQEELLHTLGNLTLTGYNSELSDRPFNEKCTIPGGFKESPLRLNEGLGQLPTWDEAAIRARAGRLADKALTVWPTPKLDAQTLDAYRPDVAATSFYTINDHPFLLASGMREVFAAFRKEVLALDPCVSEEFLKLYVAYKAETNFVDVIPQAKRLRLSIKLPFAELKDPRGICRDVTDLGRWGNGDVEVALADLAELPYVMGLVRQAFERQMGDGGQL